MWLPIENIWIYEIEDGFEFNPLNWFLEYYMLHTYEADLIYNKVIDIDI